MDSSHMSVDEQQILIALVSDPKTLAKAAEGMIDKKQKLIDRVHVLSNSNHTRCIACDDYITPLDSIAGIHPDCLYVDGD